MRRAVLTTIAVAVFFLYVISNQLLAGRPAPTLDIALDHAIPFVPAAEFVYMFVYLLLFLPVVQVKHMRVFERVAYAFWTFNLFAMAIFVLFPVRVERAAGFPLDTLASWGVAFNYAYDPPYNSFPSLHVANAVFAALIAHRLDPPVGRGALALAGVIAISTLLVKQHWIADVVAGIALGAAAYKLIVAPAVPEGATREELVFDRRLILVLPGIYAVFLIVMAWMYFGGMKPF